MGERRLKRDELQSRDPLEVALVACGDGVITFHGASADEQIIERDRDALLRRFGMDLSDQFRSVGRNRIDHYSGLQIVEKRAAGLAAFGCVGAMDAVDEFGHADRAERSFTFADPLGNVLEKARHVEVVAARLDHDAGIEDYPQVGDPMACCVPRSRLRRLS